MENTNRPWFRFSLRTLLILTTGLCIYLGVRVNQARDQKTAIAAIDALGGTYGVHVEGPEWLRKLVGDDELFYNAARVSFGPGNDGYDPNQPFGDDELDDIIPHLNEFSKFYILSLNSTQVSDTGLSHLRKLRCLEILRLCDTNITDAGLEKLIDFKTLRGVELSGSKVTLNGVTKLQKSLPDCKIEF